MRVVAAYAAMCAIWGTTWLAIKIGLRGLPPVTGSGLRFLIAGIFLAALARIVPGPRGTRASWRAIAILAAALFGGNYALTYYAETGIASGLVAVLFGTLPFFVFAFDAMLLRKPVAPAALIGAAIALAGVALIAIGPDARADFPYVAATLGASALSAFANVELKLHAASDPFRTLPPAMLLAGLVMAAGGIAFEHVDWAAAGSPSSLTALVYLAVFGSGIAFSLNHWLLRHLATWAVGISALIVPVIAVVVGAVAGGEAFGIRQLAGAALVLAGVFLALRSPLGEPAA